MSRSLFPEQSGRSFKPMQTLLEQVRVGGNLETGDLIQIINHFRPTYRRQKVCPQQLPKDDRTIRQCLQLCHESINLNHHLYDRNGQLRHRLKPD